MKTTHLLALVIFILAHIAADKPAYAINSLDAADGSPTNAVYVNNGGDVGIGTTSPEARLHVCGSDPEIILSNPQIPTWDPLYDPQAPHSWVSIKYDGDNFSILRIHESILRAESTILTWKTSGYVGIGTSNPSQKLQVAGTIYSTSGGFKFPDGTVQTTAATGSSNGGSSGGDNLGNHTATQNIKLNENWLSGDGENEGVYVTNSGNVGIGTTSPAEKLHVCGDIRLDPGGDITFADDNTRIRESSDDLRFEADDDIYISPDDDIRMDGSTLFVDGSEDSVGIGTTSPSEKLQVVGTIYSTSGGFKFPDGTVQTTAASGGSSGGGFSLPYTGSISRTGNAFSITNTGSGKAIYAKGGSGGYAAEFRGKVKISSRGSGSTVMELGEGLDYAEGFNISNEDKINPGSVLVIDSDNPGKLTLSTRSYDKKVAGIVAGAKGLGSGVHLGAGQFDYPVALAGRVYCNADATEAAIEPGDLLTTSSEPGYAAKATDYKRAQGAILGKAMEKIEKGKKGQILVLVTLQ